MRLQRKHRFVQKEQLARLLNLDGDIVRIWQEPDGDDYIHIVAVTDQPATDHNYVEAQGIKDEVIEFPDLGIWRRCEPS